jgi:methyl-accepting chemotaxis protein
MVKGIELIVERMRERGVTVEALAETTESSTQTITRARKGANLGTETLERILTELDLRLRIEDASRALEK